MSAPQHCAMTECEPSHPTSAIPAVRLLPGWSRPEALPTGADAWMHSALGRWARRRMRAQRLFNQGHDCAARCEALTELDDTALQRLATQMRAALRRDPVAAKGQLVEALAVLGQWAARRQGTSPYAVQYMGALALHQGAMAEMATGEGKTLTVALAASLAAWSGRPCHVVTANDYLAQRDAQSMGGFYAAVGVKVASVHGKIAPPERAAIYDADVVYATPKELLADHLRDQAAWRQGQSHERQALRRWLGAPGADVPSPHVLVRGLHTAIVDEADSVFIDEAVTPLILAERRPARGLDQAVVQIAAWSQQLVRDQDYVLDGRQRSARLTHQGRERVSHWAAGLPQAWRPLPRAETLMAQALQVKHFFRSGQQYLVQDGEVVLLDEQTGRLTPGRHLSTGLHQAIEAAEGLAITEPNEASSQMSFQAFFRGFERLSGCSGTGSESAAELWRVFGLPVVRVPTHRPRQVRQATPRWCVSEAAKWQAVTDEVRQLHAQGRPVLVGVRSVVASEALASLMREQGLHVDVLNARAHELEAALVAQAGEIGRITIATNMAGRGTDIRLPDLVRAGGGLHVVIAEVNDSARVDRQLAGRCGRQGDPGSVSIWVSPEDVWVRRWMPASWQRLAPWLAHVGPTGQGWMLTASLRWAQQRHEAEAYARRLSVLQADTWVSQALPFHQGAVT